MRIRIHSPEQWTQGTAVVLSGRDCSLLFVCQTIIQLFRSLAGDEGGRRSALFGRLAALLVGNLPAEGEDGLGEHERHQAQVASIAILHHLNNNFY